MSTDFFPISKETYPTIYAYTENNKEYKDYLKIGYTTRSVEERMAEHYPTKGPKNISRYKVCLVESSMKNDGSFFTDREVHTLLKKNNIKNVGGEWFKCTVDEVSSAIVSLKNNTSFEITRNKDFKLRPEQKNAVDLTLNYFTNFNEKNVIPRFLWNCKMRFGKTFATYKLAQEANWSKILILTFKPAVESAWKEDLLTHVDFQNWEFVSRDHKNYEDIDNSKPFVCFASFQDFLGKNKSGGIKVKNKWAHNINWDCIILDEYHFGAWRDSAKELYDAEDDNEKKISVPKKIDIWDENISPLSTKHYLYLSGTPFRAIETGEFIEEQIFNWTYMDEQKAKTSWNKKNNPYEDLPRMVMMTYQLPESITGISEKGEFDEFDLNVFFKASGEGDNAKFKYENEVQKWLDLIRGSGFDNVYDNLKLGKDKPVLPFGDARLLSNLNHTCWFLPSIAACYAMKNLLNKQNNTFYHDYEIIVAAGSKAGIGLKAIGPVKDAMGDPLKSKTITLSCGKLATGVTIKPWTGIFMLKNTTSPETYFQTAFRVQSPWSVESDSSNLQKEIIKKECYLFDFAPNRTLRLVTDYSCRLNITDSQPELKVEEFISFLPVLCFDGSSMRQVNAQEVLDFSLVGTSGSQLAKKFENPRLVQVDNLTLQRLLDNPEAVEALKNVEGFRNLNTDFEKIINQTKTINDIKKESSEKDLTDDKKELLTSLEKENKNLRKDYQEKLIQISTRIPLFMYLTEFREETLKDVITQLEPGLFQKVTGVKVKDFELFCSIGLFNSSLMNSAVFAFKRYENASLHYAGGLTKYNPKEVGLFDTKLSQEEFINLNP